MPAGSAGTLARNTAARQCRAWLRLIKHLGPPTRIAGAPTTQTRRRGAHGCYRIAEARHCRPATCPAMQTAAPLGVSVATCMSRKISCRGAGGSLAVASASKHCRLRGLGCGRQAPLRRATSGIAVRRAPGWRVLFFGSDNVSLAVLRALVRSRSVGNAPCVESRSSHVCAAVVVRGRWATSSPTWR